MKRSRLSRACWPARTPAAPGRKTACRQLLAAGRRFVAFYDAVLASRKDPAQQIIDKHFSSAEYWALTNDVTGESVATEAALFECVARLAPAGIPVAD